jgi:hypothetical protein
MLSLELGGILCFKTVATGPIESFPYLVINGNCDYADSYKNERCRHMRRSSRGPKKIYCEQGD